MDREKMFALNRPETELQVELMTVASGKVENLKLLIEAGWKIYPEVLNTLIALDLECWIVKILQSVKNAPEEIKFWLEAYYGNEWKDVVEPLKLNRIASICFSCSECNRQLLNSRWKSGIRW